jgi:hypothetical protein
MIDELERMWKEAVSLFSLAFAREPVKRSQQKSQRKNCGAFANFAYAAVTSDLSVDKCLGLGGWGGWRLSRWVMT